eukprot:GHVO01068476.1.p1 GENE.GHVO01068476.1~~GHVO01068476.1.p1  ORF type:complete len:422 (-),score=42.81 GHVO01068476.1:116-1381(-)
MAANDSTPPPAQIGRWRLSKKLGSGSFGDIFLGYDPYNGQQVAIKLEQSNIKFPQLMLEAKIYRLLRGAVGIPEIIWHGQEKKWNVLVMQRLGSSLETLFNRCGRLFSVRTAAFIGHQVLERLELFHSKNLIHRDVKPDNLLVPYKSESSNTSTTIYMIDYGLSKRYRDSYGRHIPYREGKSLTGTARYASINTHLGAEQSRRDDIEATIYMLLYFMKGVLPWQGLRGLGKEQKYARIQKKKIETRPEELCADVPREFLNLLKYTRSLRFDAKPDYWMMKSVLRRLFETPGTTTILMDWQLSSSHTNQHRSLMAEPLTPSPATRRETQAGGKNSKSQMQTNRSPPPPLFPSELFRQAPPLTRNTTPSQQCCRGPRTVTPCGGRSHLLGDPPRRQHLLDADRCPVFRLRLDSDALGIYLLAR